MFSTSVPTHSLVLVCCRQEPEVGDAAEAQVGQTGEHAQVSHTWGNLWFLGDFS